MNNSRVSKILFSMICTLLVVICAVAIAAQSGRQVKKSTPLPPVPTPQPEPTAVPTPENQEPKFTFLIGIDRFSGYTRISLHASSGVLRNCADRLDDSRLVKAQIAPGELTRSDAVRKAKEGKDTHVVWIQLRANTVTGQTGVYDDPSDVYIQYAVFAPTTGKQVTSGNTYPEAYRNRRIRVPSPTINEDYYLNEAARGAAERILNHFNLPVPNTRG